MSEPLPPAAPANAVKPGTEGADGRPWTATELEMVPAPVPCEFTAATVKV